jgi:uncharacterized protein with ParB-like and HNH nuclease domain
MNKFIVLDKKEKNLVNGGKFEIGQELKNFAGNAADVLENLGEKLDEISGNPKPKQQSPLSQELEQYDWCTCGFRNGTTKSYNFNKP